MKIVFVSVQFWKLHGFDFPLSYFLSHIPCHFLKSAILQNKNCFFFRNTFGKAEIPAFVSYVLLDFVNFVLYVNLSFFCANRCLQSSLILFALFFFEYLDPVHFPSQNFLFLFFYFACVLHTFLL